MPGGNSSAQDLFTPPTLPKFSDDENGCSGDARGHKTVSSSIFAPSQFLKHGYVTAFAFHNTNYLSFPYRSTHQASPHIASLILHITHSILNCNHSGGVVMGISNYPYFRRDLVTGIQASIFRFSLRLMSDCSCRRGIELSGESDLSPKSIIATAFS